MKIKEKNDCFVQIIIKKKINKILHSTSVHHVAECTALVAAETVVAVNVPFISDSSQ